MKNIITITITLVVLLLSQDIYAQKKQKVVYEFPDAMAENLRTQYAELADKGLSIYQITCAKCHGKKAKATIPDFTLEQLEAYQIRISNATHEAELQETALTAEELSLITIFFTYKKKSEAAKKNEAKNKVAVHTH